MGIDWHPYVERKVDGQWVPNWEPMLHPTWWFEYLLRKKIAEGSLKLLLPKSSNLMTDGATLFQEIPLHLVETEYGHHNLMRIWFESVSPSYWVDTCARNGKEVRVDGFDLNFRLAGRDYEWFGQFIEHEFVERSRQRTPRSSHIETGFDYYEGIPQDLSRQVSQDWDELAVNGDHHHPGHISLTDLFYQAKDLPTILPHPFPQVQWLQKHVERPEECRLIFWFY